MLATTASVASACDRSRRTTTTPAERGPDAAYYDAVGGSSSVDAFVAQARGADFVAFGELHEHPVASRLELELVRALLQAGRPFALAMEFFERDTQPAIDDYFAGRIDEATFVQRTERNEAYASSHRPLVEACREAGATVIAANAPRRLVTEYRKSNLAYDAWLASVPEAERPLLPARSVPPHDEHERRFLALMGPERGPPFFRSMALWNDAMAESCARHRDAHPDALVMLVVGAFHVAGRLGTVTAYRERRPDDRIAVLTMKDGTLPFAAEDRDEGDLVVKVPR
ncbi:MAG: ChaN family lipoprotein [Nannocystaceae bacterium]|nr:ChaN family lipoprotein [Nannocystaceae bacterium]